MGFLESGGLKLASLDRVVTHVGLSNIRSESTGTSSDEHSPAGPKRGFGFRIAAIDDRRDVEKPVGGRVVCRSPIAR